MKAVNLAEAKARLSELVVRAEGGEDIQISRRGRAVVRLVPVEQRPVREPIDWVAIDRLRDSLPMSSITVEEMRRLDIL